MCATRRLRGKVHGGRRQNLVHRGRSAVYFLNEGAAQHVVCNHSADWIKKPLDSIVYYIVIVILLYHIMKRWFQPPANSVMKCRFLSAFGEYWVSLMAAVDVWSRRHKCYKWMAPQSVALLLPSHPLSQLHSSALTSCLAAVHFFRFFSSPSCPPLPPHLFSPDVSYSLFPFRLSSDIGPEHKSIKYKWDIKKYIYIYKNKI